MKDAAVRQHRAVQSENGKAEHPNVPQFYVGAAQAPDPVVFITGVLGIYKPMMVLTPSDARKFAAEISRQIEALTPDAEKAIIADADSSGMGDIGVVGDYTFCWELFGESTIVWRVQWFNEWCTVEFHVAREVAADIANGLVQCANALENRVQLAGAPLPKVGHA